MKSKKKDLTVDEAPSAAWAASLASAIADATRLRLLSLIIHNPDICVCDLEAVTELSQTKISKHLAILRKLQLVTQRREGTWMHYSARKANGKFEQDILELVRKAHKSIPMLKHDRDRLTHSLECEPERAGRLVQVKLPKGEPH